MTAALDGERFEAHLREQLASLRASAAERHQKDDEVDAEGQVHEDHTALRMDGGTALLQLLINTLPNFALAAAPSRRKPIEQIEAPAAIKLRRRDPGTSWDAATQQSPEKSQRLYKAIHRILSAAGPKTDDELIGFMEARNFPHTPSGVRSRRRELTDAGWVRDSGTKRPSNAGGPSIVWEAVPEDA